MIVWSELTLFSFPSAYFWSWSRNPKFGFATSLQALTAARHSSKLCSDTVIMYMTVMVTEREIPAALEGEGEGGREGGRKGGRS